MKLTWTGPVDNTPLQANISYEKVANVAVDMFCDPTSAVKAASVESATPVGDEQPIGRASKKSVFDDILASEKLPWRIPDLVERGFEIPICLTSTSATPEFGQFKRLGMDVVVNAVWLAYYWAKTEADNVAVSALETSSAIGPWTSC